jgi:hypothetical protein
MIPISRSWNGWWLSSCLFFFAALCFLTVAALGRRSEDLYVIAGLSNGVAGFVGLVRLRRTLPAQAAASLPPTGG